jgi:hypothetical protein
MLGRARRFLWLPAHDRRLLVLAWSALFLTRLGLWLVSLVRLRRMLARLAPPLPRAVAGTSHPVGEVVWALTAASRWVPAPTCLTQALAAQMLLARRGCPTSLQIGVARAPGGGVEAHAWLEVRGVPVIGGIDDLARFRPLIADEAISPRDIS